MSPPQQQQQMERHGEKLLQHYVTVTEKLADVQPRHADISAEQLQVMEEILQIHEQNFDYVPQYDQLCWLNVECNKVELELEGLVSMERILSDLLLDYKVLRVGSVAEVDAINALKQQRRWAGKIEIRQDGEQQACQDRIRSLEL